MSGKIKTLSDNEVLEQIKKGLSEKYIKPSKQVIDRLNKGIFTQNDLEFLVKYGIRDNKYDYIKPKGNRLVYGISVTNKDQQTYYGQFDLKHNTLITMEKIDFT